MSKNTEGTIQIPPSVLALPDPTSTEILGQWKNNVHKLHEKFVNHRFQHVIIDDFFTKDHASKVLEAWPRLNEFPQLYHNPFEQRQYVHNDLAAFTGNVIAKTFYQLNSPNFAYLMKKITGINDLECDPYLHGGGINSYPSGGNLDLHIDYSIHPYSKKERRINLLIYLSDKDWQEDWGGATEMWDSTFGKQKPLAEPMMYPPVGNSPLASATPYYNRALIFATKDYSWHAVSPISCPRGKTRRSINVYYVSEPRGSATKRYKAFFVARPTEKSNVVKDRLRHTRLVRRLNDDDSREYFESLTKSKL